MPTTVTPTSKILPPEIPSRFVPRSRLEEAVSGAFGHRITQVIAGPGFGKSSLLASWAEKVPVAWYTLDTSDAELGPFAAGLAEAIRLRVPALPADFTSPVVAGGPGADEAGRAEALVGLLCEFLDEHLSEDLALILDDVQEVDPSSASAGVIGAICRQAPGRLHVILASRLEPPFSVQRMRGRGQLLEIGPQQLSFRPDEVAAVLRALAIEPDEAAVDLHELTAGWPAAVRLAAEVLHASEPAERSLAMERLVRPEGPLFGYLAEEVLHSEPPEVHQLLEKVAALERFTPELCRVLGLEGADEVLTRLERRGVLVERLAGDGGWMRLTPVVRDAILERSGESARDPKLLLRVAAWLEEKGVDAEALRCLVDAGDVQALAALLVARGERMIDAGGARQVAEAAERIEQHIPELGIVLGIARQALGEWDEALRLFAAATDGLASVPARIAWRMGVIHYLRGDPDAAGKAFARGRIEGADTGDEALLLAWSAALHWMRGDVDATKEQADRAIAAASACGDDRALAAAHTAQAMQAALVGDRRANDAHYLKALDAAERAGDVFQVVRVRTNRSSHLFEEGWYEKAREEIDLAIRAAEIAGFTPLLALAYSNRGWISLRQGNLDEAVRDFELARSLYQRLDSRRISYPLVGLGDVYRERGDLALARGCYEEAIRQSEPGPDLQGLVPGLAGLGRLLVSDDPDEAAALCDRAMSFGNNLDHPSAVVSAGWVALVGGDRDRGQELGRAAGLLARERRDRAVLAEALELQALSSEPLDRDLLEQAARLWRELGNEIGSAKLALILERIDGKVAADAPTAAEARLAALGVRLPATSAGLLAALPVVAPKSTAVRTLGGFALLHDGRPLPSAEWQSKKSRDLLKVLIARRGRTTHREALMDILWPDEDPETVANRLSVALSGLRSALDPDHRVDPDHYVSGDRETVGLSVDLLDVDVERFLSLAERGHSLLRKGDEHEGLGTLRQAETLYTGDFLEEDPYEEWAIPLREEARAAYIAAARALAERAAKAGDHDTTIRCSLRILERDPYDEAAALGLVRAAVASGRHGEARRHYASYVTRMRELDVEPAPFPAAITGSPD